MRHNNGTGRGVSAIFLGKHRGDPGALRRGNRRGWKAVMAAVMVLAMLVVASCRGGQAADHGRASAGVAASGMAVAAQEAGAGSQGKSGESAGADKPQEAGKKPELEFVGSLAGHTQRVTCFDFSPDGKWIASGSNDGTVRVWDVATGSTVMTLSLDEQVARCIGFSPDGTMLACGGGDSENTNRGLHVWSCHSWARFPQMEADGAVISLSWSPDSVALAVETRTWSSRRVDEIFERKERNTALVAVAVSGVWARTIQVKESTDKDKEQSNYGRSDLWPELSPWYSPTGNMIAYRHYQYQKCEDAITGQERDLPHRIPTFSEVSKRGKHAVIRREVESVIVDFAALLSGSIVELSKLGDHKFIGFVGDDKVLMAKDGRLHQLTLGGTGDIRAFSEPGFQYSEDCDVVLAERVIALRAYGVNGLTLYDAENATELRRIGGHMGSALCVAARPQQPQIASGGSDGSVCLWDTDKACYVRSMTGGGTVEVDGAEVQLPRPHSERVNTVTFNPDGKLLASGSNDRRVIIWNPDTGKPVRELKGHHHSVTSLAFSPDGKWLASGSDDCTVRMWKVETGKQFLLLKDIEGPVKGVAFAYGGELVLASGAKCEPDNEYISRLSAWRSDGGQHVANVGFDWGRPVALAPAPGGVVIRVVESKDHYWKGVAIAKSDGEFTLTVDYAPGDFVTHSAGPFEDDNEWYALYDTSGVLCVSGNRGSHWAFERIAANADQSVIALAGDPENPLKPIQLWRLNR